MSNSRESRLRALLQSEELKQFQHISISENRTEIYSSDVNRIYIPSPTGIEFEKDNSFVSLVMGPYGSGKTTMCINKIVKRACDMPAWSSGRRKSRWIIVRNTSGELYSTTLQSWLAWFAELGDIKKRQKPLLTYEHTFNDGRGIVELELIFLALDREDDIRKIKSLEATGVYINELNEVPQGALSHFKGRINHRYPSPQFCNASYWSGIIADTNPPDIDHWIYRTFELEKPESYRIFHQPPGLLKVEGKWERNRHADNANNLANNYYTMLAEGQTDQFVKVFCLGEYGIVGFGKLVYPEFNDDINSVDEIAAIQGAPIHLGWDFGLTPACIVCQLSEHGRLFILKEYTSEDMGIQTFAESIVLPGLARDFPYCKIGMSRADPSGLKHDEIMEELSCIGVLNTIGIETHGARTNLIDPRLSAVRFFLNRLVGGKPGLVISRKGCPMLRRGFSKDYVFKRISIAGEERYREIPDKNHASHPHDGLQYIALEFAANCIVDEKAKKEIVDMFNPVFRWQS